jgi:hypothetical protein
MKTSFVSPALPKSGMLVLLVPEGAHLDGLPAEADRRTEGQIARAMAAGRFTGKRDTTLDLVAPGGGWSRIVLFGLGEPGTLRPLDLEMLGGAAAGVMVGRHAIRNPWIFRQIAEQLEGRRLMHIREALADAAGLAKIPKKTFTALRALAVRSVFEDDGVSGLAKLADVEKDAKGMLGAEWNGLMEHIRSALPETYNEYDAATLKVIAELVGADLKALRKAARAAIESETEI